MAKEQFVQQIRAGTGVDTQFTLVRMELRPLRSGKGEYLSLILADKSGQIQARLWDNAAAVASSLREGLPVRVKGSARDYQGETQVYIDDIALLDNPDAGLLAELATPPQVDINRLKKELVDVRDNLANDDLQALLGIIFETQGLGDAFAAAPAAKSVHHAYTGGLLEHSLEVVRFCEAACQLFPALQRDVLITAALLHDIGKTKEYTASPSIEISDEGRLIGHVAVGLRMLDRALAQLPCFPPKLADHLSHLLLSHHGELANGSPILPLTMEAIALHMADMASAKLKQFEQVLAGRGQSEWSQYDRLLGRFVYGGFAAAPLDEGSGCC
jgi:3'-5' exoribonuclease